MAHPIPAPRLPTDLPPSSVITPEEAAAMMRAVFGLFERWGVTDAEGMVLLGRPSPRTYARWKAREIARVPYDTAVRLTYLMGIHKALRYLFAEPDRAYAWVRKPTPAFGGQSAMQRMLGGDLVDLAAVRTYLDAERGGW